MLLAILPLLGARIRKGKVIVIDRSRRCVIYTELAFF